MYTYLYIKVVSIFFIKNVSIQYFFMGSHEHYSFVLNAFLVPLFKKNDVLILQF
jgi:hypothetical protein